MERPTQMSTLSQILEKLRVKRMDHEFKMVDNKFEGINGKHYPSNELTIIKTFRFESESDPSDSSVLYIIEAIDGLIGYTIDAYGVYSNHVDDGYDDFIRTINVQDRDEQQIFESKQATAS